jgi:arylsulfatase/uncharacterized sulfatase
VAAPGTSYRGQPIEPLAGRSLVPVLTGAATGTRSATDAIGYELSGNSAYFLGDLKLVRNLPPVGDGAWHLYDLRADPGETRDLQQQRPDVFKALQAAYDAWALAHGVLPIPEGYQPTRQVLINSFVNYWIPAYKNTAFGLLAGVLGLVALLVIWRRRSRA